MQERRVSKGTVPFSSTTASPRCPRKPGQSPGFSLLEVILALAILAGALAVLGEASRLALKNAEIARDTTRAQMLCESKLAEIVTGAILPDPVDSMPFDETTTDSLDPSEPGWLYSIEQEPTDEDGLIAVRVTVGRDLPEARHPVRFSLVRWMADPNATTSSDSDQMGTSDSSSMSSAASSGGTKGGS